MKEEGIKIGKEEGIKIGKEMVKLKYINNMLNKGFNLDVIIDILELSKSDVEKLINKI